ncbi:MAG: cupin domain-containing protein [Anaerolineae bacterium]
MSGFETNIISSLPDAIAPDGSEVRTLLRLTRGSMAQFALPAGQTSVPVAHRTVEEIWFFTGGRGEMWRRLGEQEDIVTVGPGICITIPVGTRFQFRSLSNEPLVVVGVTMPPWPGPGETLDVEGPWVPTLRAGTG